jgi:hypothetical protein
MTGSVFMTQFAFKHQRLSDATTRNFVEFYNNSGADLCGFFRISTNGELLAYDETSALVQTSAPGVITENVWQYGQMKITIGDSGSIVAKVGADEVINISGVDTKPGTAVDVDKVTFNGASDDLSLGIYYDDFIFMDGSGTKNNDLRGDRRVYTLLATGDDGTEADFSSQPAQAVGSTYLNVDDPVPGAADGDTSYNHSSTPGDETLHDFENLPIVPAVVDAVQVTLCSKKSDAGARSMAAVMQADVKEAGATFNPGTDYEETRTIWEQTTEASPDDWTGAKVNAVKAGYKLVS